MTKKDPEKPDGRRKASSVLNQVENSDLKKQLDRIEKKLDQLLSYGSPLLKELRGVEQLDPAEVDLEDRRILEAERRMPEDEAIIFRAEIYAARLCKMGNPTTAERMLKRAYAKAAKLRNE